MTGWCLEPKHLATKLMSLSDKSQMVPWHHATFLLPKQNQDFTVLMVKP